MMERSGEPGNGEGAAPTANLEAGRQSTAAMRYEVTFSPHTLPRVLLIMALVLLAAHAVLAIYHYRVEELSWLLLQLFDVDEENNLPTWFSGSLLLTTSAFLWLCARKKRADADPWFRQWYVLAVGFLLMPKSLFPLSIKSATLSPSRINSRICVAINATDSG